jgi:restriction endonuclease S subunit
MLRPKSATASPLTLSALMRIQVPLPSIEEQILIARLAGAIDYRLTISNSRRKLLEELLESVLKGIMSGHFRFPASQ